MARPRLHDDSLRAALLDVASQQISEHGESAVTVRGVAQAAGTSASAVYALFGSREDLVAAVSVEGFRRFAEHLSFAPRTGSPADDLLALGLAYRTSALADPHFYRVMFERSVPPETGAVPAVAEPTFDVLRRAVGRVLASADSDAAGAPPASSGLAAAAEEASLALWGLVHGLVSLEIGRLLPGGAEAAARRYERAILAVGPPLLRAAPTLAAP
ncbi:TetR/AcrR family transcriptional regulator [Oerskovia merdavium]|uniref:TetR/AcrR family transcriptional regulator n=1 Tax=Oerskovia merdavium TaxID=2762227 RepID=A0ABR8U017_9CELL|nr:TetR/AcrR family transcriptional regulator [Oerskovia merdavium]MBD7981354.1 TetR/AcrR family transcriptional regulator [Oerskovia merdavium]